MKKDITYFGDMEINYPQETTNGKVTIDNHQIELDLNFYYGVPEHDWVAEYESYIKNLKQHKTNVEAAIRSDYEDGDDVKEYVDFHLEELDAPTIDNVLAGTDYSKPKEERLLSVLELDRIGFYPGGSLESYMAEQGFIMVAVDGRGTGGRGAEFQKCTYLTLGDKESKDQVEAAIYLGTLPYVDKDNIGIWGWSFGGFNTLMSMSEGRPVFKAGVAVAAPTNWKFYDTVYTERYMRTPNENASGYAINPIERANKLHGDLLLIHGTADDNVHYRNAAEYSEALVQANKQFDMQVYTNRNHNIFGGNTRYHLFTRYANFFKTHLMK